MKNKKDGVKKHLYGKSFRLKSIRDVNVNVILWFENVKKIKYRINIILSYKK